MNVRFFFTDMLSFVRAVRASAERDYMSGWTLEGLDTVNLHDVSAGKYGGNLSLRGSRGCLVQRIQKGRPHPDL